MPNELPLVHSPNFGPLFWDKYLPLRVEFTNCNDDGEDLFQAFGLNVQSGRVEKIEWPIYPCERRDFAHNAAVNLRNLANLFDAFARDDIGQIDTHTETVEQAVERKRQAEEEAERDEQDED